MQLILLTAAVALLALIFAGLVLTWICADDQPIFGPYKPGRVTFKTVLHGFLKDLSDLFHVAQAVSYTKRLWAWWSPRLTNPQLWAWAASVVGTFFASDPITLMHTNPRTFFALVIAVVVVSAVLKPFNPDGAPRTLPPAITPAGGPGAEAMRAGA